MSLSSDLVQDSRLDTTIRSDGITVHAFLELSTRERLVERKEYWRRERRIGRGGFGQVHLQKCIKGVNEGAVRAVKILDKPCGAKSAEKLHLELEALAKFSHQKYHSWFVHTFGWYEDIESIFIAMEYCQHGDLQTYLKGNELSLGETRDLIRQVLEAVDQMHRNDFVHRDLKPDPWWLVLADFGISKRVQENCGPSTVKGTSGFMAPELLGLLGHTPEHTTETIKAGDIWAVGEIMLQMYTGKPAFRNVRELADYCNGNHPKPSSKLGANVDEACAFFLDSLMAVYPGQRITARQSLHHSWLLDRSKGNGTSSTLGVCEVEAEIQSTASSFKPSARWTTEPVIDSQRPEAKNTLPKLESDIQGSKDGIETETVGDLRGDVVEIAAAMEASVLKQYPSDDRNPFRRGLRPANSMGKSHGGLRNSSPQGPASSEVFDEWDDLFSSMSKPSYSHDLPAKSTGENETPLEREDNGMTHPQPTPPVPLRFPELWKTSPGPSVLHDVLEVKKLVKMGWPRPLVVQALEKTDYDFSEAVKYLCRPSPPAPEVPLRSNPNDWSPAIKGTLSSPPQLVSPPPPPPPPAVDDFSPSHAVVIASRNSVASLRRAAVDRWRQAGHALYPMSISNQARVKPIDSSKEFSRGTFAEPRRRIGDSNLRKRSEDICKAAASPNFG